ncbi:MAG: GrdX family protein [Lachnospiraceae bacterium]
MKKAFEIITNNPLVYDKLNKEYNIRYSEISYEDILKEVRNRVYEGYQLLTHPLSGSVKPNETPYKSVMVSTTKGTLDLQSVEIIENAIHAVGKFEFKSDRYQPEVYDDFQVIDLTLIESALPSATAQL